MGKHSLKKGTKWTCVLQV